MRTDQYKRLFNVFFVLLVVSTGYFAFKGARWIINTQIIDQQKDTLRKVADDEERRTYNELIAQGKKKEAEVLIGEPHTMLLAIPFSQDVSQYPYLQRIKWLQLRIEFFSESLELLSAVLSLCFYTAAYFLIWRFAVFIVRYVRNAPAP